MADSIRVDDSELRELAARLKEIDPELRKELFKRLRAAAKPITPATRAVALAKLPAGGGLNKQVAEAKQTITARAGKTTATVAVVLSARQRGSGAWGADQGLVRHPVFGNRERWVNTKVPPRWFTDTAEKEAGGRADEVDQVMDDIARKAGFR